MDKNRDSLTNQLRLAIANCGISRYRIAKETGVGQSTLALFVNGKRGLSMEAIDSIGHYLRLKIATETKPRTGRK